MASSEPIDHSTLVPGVVIRFIDSGNGPSTKGLDGDPDQINLVEGTVSGKVHLLDDGAWWVVAYVDAVAGEVAVAGPNVVEVVTR